MSDHAPEKTTTQLEASAAPAVSEPPMEMTQDEPNDILKLAQLIADGHYAATPNVRQLARYALKLSAAPVSEEIAKLRDFIAEHRWQLGFAGGANIVRFTDSNIVGIGTAAQPDALIEAHNSALDQVDALLSALQQEKVIEIDEDGKVSQPVKGPIRDC